MESLYPPDRLRRRGLLDDDRTYSAFRFEFDRPEEALLLFRVGNEGEIEITEGHRIISGWERIGDARQYFHATILSRSEILVRSEPAAR